MKRTFLKSLDTVFSILRFSVAISCIIRRRSGVYGISRSLYSSLFKRWHKTSDFMNFCRERHGKVTVQHKCSCHMPYRQKCGLLILNLRARWRWMLNATFRPLYPRKREPVPIVQESGGGAQGRCDLGVGKIKSLATTGVRVSNVPALGESFCQLKELPTCLYSRFTYILYVYVYVYIYIYTLTHTHTHTSARGLIKYKHFMEA